MYPRLRAGPMTSRALLASGLLLASIAALAAPAAAHTHVCVHGASATDAGEGGSCGPENDLHFVVGWSHEPAFVGLVNGLDLAVKDPKSNDDAISNVTDLEAAFEFGGKVFLVELRPNDEMGEGWYTGDIQPTRPGVYAVHVSGSVDGHAVDFRQELEEATTTSDIAFPEPAPDPGAMEQRIADLEAKVTSLTSQVNALKANSGSNRSGVTPVPDNKGLPGFEAPLAVLGAAGVALLAARRQRGGA